MRQLRRKTVQPSQGFSSHLQGQPTQNHQLRCTQPPLLPRRPTGGIRLKVQRIVRRTAQQCQQEDRGFELSAFEAAD